MGWGVLVGMYCEKLELVWRGCVVVGFGIGNGVWIIGNVGWKDF